MARKLTVLLACAVLAASTGAATRGAREDGGRQALPYGTDPLQAVDYWAGPTRDAPLVVFVHGGGWKRGDKRMMAGSDKLAHWRAQGYAVASVNYIYKVCAAIALTPLIYLLRRLLDSWLGKPLSDELKSKAAAA